MGIVQHDETITIEANRLRNEQLKRFYSPETGEGSDTGDRRPIRIGDAPLPLQYIPAAMFDEPLVQQLAQAGSLAGYLRQQGVDTPGEGRSLPPDGESDDEDDISPLLSLWREWIRVRIRYDFEFWAYSFVRIKNKLGADDIPFRLNRPQFRKILRRQSPPFQRQSDLFRREHAPLSRRQGAEFEIADADPLELYGGSADGGGDAAVFPSQAENAP